MPVALDTQQNKKLDSLFGPNIGLVSSGPPWTVLNQKKVFTDELTTDVVKSWIEKSKQPTQPTTTLQALVNLKRPTLRLSPLALDDSVPQDAHHHGLEFEYDCDAPKCGIYLHVLLAPDHPLADAVAPTLSRVLVFESVVDGGFAKLLTIDEGASLELGRFEHSPHPALNRSTPSVDKEPIPESAVPLAAPSTPEPAPGRADRRRRFSHFTFRKSRVGHSRTVSGPALAVVDAEPAPAPDASGPTSKPKDHEDGANEGVRAVIRLAALDEQGTELASPNEQVTYLHIVRFGAPPPEGEDDVRPWVVKVVKREATIGPHTFHLHEIYGLSSAPSQAQAQPTLPPTALPATPATPATALGAHTYPPAAARPATATSAAESEPSSECLVCLSSPREVVLLPCRHLVACKDCALNMVEFGAGGTIVQQDADADARPGTAGTVRPGTAGTAVAEAGTEVAEGGELPVVAPPPPPTANTRRKRKAKGWFCPVCRQPYTSLLRITTAPPEEGKDEEDDKHEDGEAEAEVAGEPSPLPGQAPGIVADAADAPPPRSRGLAAFRPAFLRGLSRNAGRGGVVPDLERGAVQA